MSGETIVHLAGNLTADPEMKFLGSGAAVCSFTVASTPRTFDKASGEWRDGDALFMRCSVWRAQAESVAESLVRGTRVMVSGRLKQRSFETSAGEKRTVVEMEVDEIGASLKHATVKVTKVSRSSDDGQSHGSSGSGGGVPVDDPWSSAPASGSPSDSDESPF